MAAFKRCDQCGRTVAWSDLQERRTWLELHWDDLGEALDPFAFTLATVPSRLAGLPADPWADMLKLDQPLPSASS